MKSAANLRLAGEGGVRQAPPARLARAALWLATGDFVPAPAVLAVGGDLAAAFENRERHGLDADDAAGLSAVPLERHGDHALRLAATP